MILCVLLMVQLTAIHANAVVPMRRFELYDQAVDMVPEVPAPEKEPEETEEEASETAIAETEAAQQDGICNSVPLYFQNGYTDALYGSGTVATHGSGITCLAMVASYLTEHAYAPDELADYFGGYTGNYMEKLEYAANELQLPWSRVANCHDALRELQDGKVVIVLTSTDSIFNYAQHFVVWTGMNEEGRVLVNDPNENNYSHWRLVSGFESGFTQSEVCAGFKGAWVFDKSEMSADPFIYVEEEKPQVECRYPDIRFTKEELELFAKIVWLEARGESAEGQQAVAEVIINRLAADNFPNTLYWVIHAEGQFPSVEKLHEAEPTQTQYEAIEAALNGPYILPEDVVFYATYKVNSNVWGQIGGHWFCYQWNWTEE